MQSGFGSQEGQTPLELTRRRSEVARLRGQTFPIVTGAGRRSEVGPRLGTARVAADTQEPGNHER
jgi:hypothetical protein